MKQYLEKANWEVPSRVEKNRNASETAPGTNESERERGETFCTVGGRASGPIKAALKRFGCPAVTPGTMEILSAISADFNCYLFLLRDWVPSKTYVLLCFLFLRHFTDFEAEPQPCIRLPIPVTVLMQQHHPVCNALVPIPKELEKPLSP